MVMDLDQTEVTLREEKADWWTVRKLVGITSKERFFGTSSINRGKCVQKNTVDAAHKGPQASFSDSPRLRVDLTV